MTTNPVKPIRTQTERTMKTRRSSFSRAILSLVGGTLAGLFLAATPAYAQTMAVSNSTPTASGTVGTPTLGAAFATGPEAINCSGPVKITTTAVNDPTLGPQVVVYVDLRGLSCLGQSTGMAYANSGQANLTRPLAATDTVKTTFALYPNTAGGYMTPRTGLATLNLTYNTTTGALTGASASIGSF